jgi:hypothetical protein
MMRPESGSGRATLGCGDGMFGWKSEIYADGCGIRVGHASGDGGVREGFVILSS